MKTGRGLWWGVLCAAVLLTGSQAARGQRAPVPSRVIEQVDEARTLRVAGNVHPLARAEFDRGAVGESQPMTRMLLLLQRSTEQETALRQLLDAQQDKGSANYHAWMTPEQFGKQFGPSDADLRAVTDWLTRQGFQIAKVSAGRTLIEFSGNVAQVQNAFHTEIRRFAMNGREHIANVNDPAIPSALSPVVRGVVALNNFPKHSQFHKVGSFQRDLTTGQVKAQFTYTNSNGTFYALGPADFAKIYNIPAGADGSGQSIAIVGQSNIQITDVRQFRSMFGLPANDPEIIVNGPDPGIVDGDESESDLDVEWATAVAPGATIKFVASQSTISNPTQVSAGVDLSALYIIDNNIAPVMSESYGLCEAFLGTTGNAFYDAMWQQAAAQGITVSVATGDNGSAGCDPISNPNAASFGIAVSGVASTPYNVAVGGTDFNQFNNWTPYWHDGTASDPNNPTTQLSAKGYIPEVPWDDSLCAANFPNPCATVDTQNGDDISAGSGGPSNCITSTGSGSSLTCTAGYAKPAWQAGLGDTHRDLPDISFFASNGFNSSFYIVCEADANPGGADCDLSTSPTSPSHNFIGVGGTSASAPAFAAVMALVNQKTGQRQGNANYVLYALQKKQVQSGVNCDSSTFTDPTAPAPASCVFYDATVGNNSVACVAGSPNCSNTTSSGFGILVSGGKAAFTASTGYDLATGLGSINVANLLTLWSSAVRTATTTALSSASASSLTSGQTFSVKVTVTPTSSTGDVSLIATTSGGTTAAFGPYTLASGIVTASTNLLPPGTTSIVAYYAGDATHAPSTSAPLTLTVGGANQASVTTASFVTFSSTGAPILSTAAQSLPYGSPYILQIAVTHSSGTPCTAGGTLTTPGIPCPTGTVTITDNGNALNDWPNAGTANATNVAKLNNQGVAEDQPVQFGVGSHSVVASYAGDLNYNASASNTLSVTITKAATATAVASNLGTITPGASVILTALISSNSNGAGPTGTVQFANGSANLGAPVSCTPTSGAQNSINGTAYCTATVTTAISALYPAPQNRPRPPVAPIVLLALSIVAYLMALRWMPETRRRAYAYTGLVAIALLVAGIAGCGGSGGGGGGGKTVTIHANYTGDSTYTASAGSTTIHVQ